MTSRERVLACIERRPFDRVAIRHLGEVEIDDILYKHFGLPAGQRDALLDAVGDDFRSIEAVYEGPNAEDYESSLGIVSGQIWVNELRKKTGSVTPFADMESVDELEGLIFPDIDVLNYSTVPAQCEKYKDYAKIAGYCELDLINTISFVRGYQNVFFDIAERNPLYLKLIEEKTEFAYRHIESMLKAADGRIDIVHFADDLGTQQGLLFSLETLDDIFAGSYARCFKLAHDYGAKTMMHSCGSVWKAIPRLIELGLDILDVVQTNAAGMEISGLKEKYGDKIVFAGTMCVQNILPFHTKTETRDEVQKRLELFKDGGLILGPSHLIQVGTPLENILEMYKAAGGLK